MILLRYAAIRRLVESLVIWQERCLPTLRSELVFASKAEQHLACKLRVVLAGVPIGGAVDDSQEFREVLSALEFFIPQLLRELYPEWNQESLDGVYPEIARKTNECEAEIAGLCILISDQTMTPIHVRLHASQDKDEIDWLECRLGEAGADGMIRMPYGSRWLANLAVTGRLDTIEWVYCVGFGERNSSNPQ